jgi:hypothetical protein
VPDWDLIGHVKPPPGVLVVLIDDARFGNPAVTRAIKKVVGEAEGHHVKASRAPSPTPSRKWPRAVPDTGQSRVIRQPAHRKRSEPGAPGAGGRLPGVLHRPVLRRACTKFNQPPRQDLGP